ncbi:hypothetical protein IEU95_15740 [Hoyosella rhizosphaerae]|uniref:Uncharacterized protein n=1 Tax=Hoyosella rhizosphaerae TaxID=1755582 RepID=A0A916UIP5_9ACTN|nr:hypothetical protein [Hoyosella rhizosphaerae]MBN4928287.1 hypothetical protein [Hoyosella rhizosphaerae]GGC73825.1 hypothetical protein GCM10011410_28740 [Hoyosella rhizosphaerae]
MAMVRGGTINEVRQRLTDIDADLRKQLAAATLALEVNLDPDQTEALFYDFGSTLGAYMRVHKYTATEVVKKFPGAALATLVGHAATGYGKNAYWDEYFDKLGLKRAQAIENDLRQAIPKLIKGFKLDQFPEIRRPVDKVSMQAGIPNYCLADLVNLIVEHLYRGGEESGAALVDWLLDKHRESRLGRLDVPAQNFILYGGSIAIDIVDRIVALVVERIEASDNWNDRVEALADNSGLPPMMFRGIAEILSDLEVSRTSQRSTRTGSAALRAPRIKFNVAENSIQLVLPAPPDNSDTPWVVSLDGDTTEVAVEADWFGLDTDSAFETVDILSPVRRVTAEHETLERTFGWVFVDSNDPLVVFSAGGHLIGPHQPLPTTQFYAVLPKAAELVDARTQQPLSGCTDIGSPVGWAGWSLILVSIEQGEALALRYNGKFGSTRAVQQTAVPDIRDGSVIRGLLTVGKATVYGERPVVGLPPTPSSVTTQWKVMSRRARTDNWNTVVYDATDDYAAADIFETQEPLVGTFDIAIHGPLGSNLRRTINLAEGISIEMPVEIRTPHDNGLTPVSVEIESASSSNVPVPATMKFLAEDLSHPLRIDHPDGSDRFVVRPPHLSIRLDQPGKRATWSALPPVISADEIAKGVRVLSFRIPTSFEYEFDCWVEYRNAAKETKQQETPEYREHSDTFDLPLGRFSSTAHAYPNGNLMAVVRTPYGETTLLPLVHVRPETLCSRITLKEGTLTFENLAEVDGATVQIWTEAAPWRHPHTAALLKSTYDLPSELRNCGPLWARVVIDDPWMPVEAPSTPPEDATRFDQQGWFTDTDEVLTTLSQVLIGEGRQLVESSPRPELWTAMLHRASQTNAVDSQWFVSKIGGLLRRDPYAAIEALSRSNIDTEKQPKLLIRSGLVCTALPAITQSRRSLVTPWATAMQLIAELRTTQVPDRKKEIVSELAEIGGDTLLNLLRDGNASTLKHGRFGPNTAHLHKMRPEQLNIAFQEAKVVPGALLDIDTRTADIGQVFPHREQWAENPACARLNTETTRLRVTLRSFNTILGDITDVRAGDYGNLSLFMNPWVWIPLNSLTLALAARLEAHNQLPAGTLSDKTLQDWAELATLCPQLTLTDLLTAEAITTHLAHGDLVGATHA